VGGAIRISFSAAGNLDSLFTSRLFLTPSRRALFYCLLPIA
jgi:hypothetical protein